MKLRLLTYFAAVMLILGAFDGGKELLQLLTQGITQSVNHTANKDANSEEGERCEDRSFKEYTAESFSYTLPAPVVIMSTTHVIHQDNTAYLIYQEVLTPPPNC